MEEKKAGGGVVQVKKSHLQHSFQAQHEVKKCPIRGNGLQEEGGADAAHCKILILNYSSDLKYSGPISEMNK